MKSVVLYTLFLKNISADHFMQNTKFDKKKSKTQIFTEILTILCIQMITLDLLFIMAKNWLNTILTPKLQVAQRQKWHPTREIIKQLVKICFIVLIQTCTTITANFVHSLNRQEFCQS